MAKGDNQRSQVAINTQGGLAQNHLNNLRNDMIIPQAQDAQNRFTRASDQNFADYDRISSGYQDWAKTGGYSDMDIANMRARGMAPVRAAYANANRDVDRKVALQGGYSPGYGVLKSRLAREQSSAMSDASTNIEAALAQMRNEGRRFGMAGQSSLYSATPGMASTYGQFSDNAMSRWLQTQGLQQNLGLGLIDAQNQKSNIPGKGQTALNNTIQLGKLITGGVGSY